ncbi:WGR and DUF4132 domain-containing protein [Intestinirhabdus alba]|uniref:WGR and DUF4132 domain-containing protein n=1 Tax=Intestinirhabdus alba TaxID=2899544 RepID=UPI00142EE3CB|nr:WGR and DUF4132 domain-containing protein [Intestinirhabdus alba]
MKIFICQDEKSHKFWAVAQQDNELHLRWGKVGTNGQSQIKTFADAAAASNAELKLITEKTRKGYVEDKASEQPPVAGQPSPPPAPSGLTPPWLADDAQLALSLKKGKQPLSHRRWPGEPVPPVTESRFQRLNSEMLSRYQPVQPLVWSYEACLPEWQQAIAQAIRWTEAEAADDSLTPLAMAALTRLWKSDGSELQDEIVQRYGIEYATEVVLARQNIAVWQQTYCPPHIAFSHPDQSKNNFSSDACNDFDLRLRKHLSLAEDRIWQRCADRLVAALPAVPLYRQPFIALLLPERPEVANAVAARCAGPRNLPSREWLKAVATDPAALASLERDRELDIFTDRAGSEVICENRHGYAACAALLREQGIAAISRLTPYAHREGCGSLVGQINHPQAIRLLLLAADKSKAAWLRVERFARKFPEAALAALAELLALPEPPPWPGDRPVDNKQLQAREERWRTLLQTLLARDPQLAGRVRPWLSDRALKQLTPRPQSSPSLVAASKDLPAILLTPPWRREKKKAAIPRFDLPALEVPPQERWLPGEQEALAAQRPARYFNNLPFAERLRLKGGYRLLKELGFEEEAWFFKQVILEGRVDDFVQASSSQEPALLAGEAALAAGDGAALIQAWRQHLKHSDFSTSTWNLWLLAHLPRRMALECWHAIHEEGFNHVGADYLFSVLGLDALPTLPLALQRQPHLLFPVLIHFGATTLAQPVARAWLRLQAHSLLARQWLLQWPEHAAVALIPLAFGKAGEDREAAINALRLLYQQGHAGLLQAVTRRWDAPQLWPALEQWLNQTPQDHYPARIPKAPDFWQPARWRRPRLKSNDRPLPDEALEIIGEMLRFSRGDRVYCGLKEVKAACQPQTLAAFAWDMFSAWQNAAAPSKENWVFPALWYFGDESTVRDLTPLILAWPQESKSARAASGLNVLARIGSDMALLQLHHIAGRAKSRPLRESAARYLQEAAKARGLSAAQLEDRLTPTLGLDDPQALTFDFGPRRFTVKFNESLQPIVYDQQGVRQKALPRLRAEDDPTRGAEALARLKGLKKDAAQVAKRLLPHLENALRYARRWSLSEFQALFIDHPLTRHLTPRLLWGLYAPEEPQRLLRAFRVAAEGEFCDEHDEPFTLPPEALTGLVHPLEMDAASRAAFGQIFADYELIPPFRQLARCTVQLTPEEAQGCRLERWQGKTTTSGQLLGLRAWGWRQSSELSFCYPLPPYQLILQISPGLNYYQVDARQKQEFQSITLYRDGKPAPFSPLSPRALSEALSAAEIIFRERSAT